MDSCEAEMSSSVVTLFDDLCNHSSDSYDACETELLEFIKKQWECQQAGMAARKECCRLQQELKEAGKKTVNHERQLQHARRILGRETLKRKLADTKCETLEIRLHELKDLLILDSSESSRHNKSQALLMCDSLLHLTAQKFGGSDSGGTNLSDLSFDRSDDNLDSQRLRQFKKQNTLTKSKKITQNETEILTSAVVSTRRGGAATTSSVPKRKPATTDVTSNPHGDTKLPCSDTAESDDCPSGLPSRSKFGGCKRPVPNSRCGGASSTLIRRINSGSPSSFNQRPHAFVDKTNIRLDVCEPCGKRMRLAESVLRCQECNTTCHRICKGKVTLPCIPSVTTSATNGVKLPLGDYTPLLPPMIPALVVHCVNEIEQRGLSERALYRFPAPEQEVKALRNRFLRGRGTPNLSGVRIHVLCCCVKFFLSTLKEPLITTIRWREFVRAAENKDPHDSEADLMQAVSDLPQPNRDTLAFLILHLQKVADSPECKMSASSLAKVFGPTVVGFSAFDPDQDTITKEVYKQQKVIERLMSISVDYWSTFLSIGAALKYSPQKGSGTPTRGMPKVTSSMFSLFR